MRFLYIGAGFEAKRLGKSPGNRMGLQKSKQLHPQIFKLPDLHFPIFLRIIAPAKKR
jgi:hypothetical protein